MFDVSADKIVQCDKIYQDYFFKENWIHDQVREKNRELQKLKKPKIVLGLFDVLNENLLYDPGSDILLVEHILKERFRVKKPLVELLNSVYGIYYMTDQSWHRNIVRDFNCFINRNDPIRQSWFYLLYDLKLLDRSYASFSGKSRLTSLPNLEYFDQIHNETLRSFDPIYQNIRKIIPYKNFEETEDLRNVMMSTKFSVIIETYFERTDALTFSEKTFRALQTPRPWLLFHATGSVKALRDMGFYVYDDIIDHSYDSFDTKFVSVERQESILLQIQKLIDLNVNDDMLDHWEKMTEKNCNLLKDFNDVWKKDVVTKIDEAYNLAISR